MSLSSRRREPQVFKTFASGRLATGEAVNFDRVGNVINRL
jgi:hypothetical protein